MFLQYAQNHAHMFKITNCSYPQNFKEKKPRQKNIFMISRIRFPTKFNDLKYCFQKSINYSKKTWSPILCWFYVHTTSLLDI